jgi:antitoxin MazE
MSMQMQIGKWGNSLAVRIPGNYAKDLDLREGMDLEVVVVGDELVLRPAKKHCSLEELVERITPENVHGETDWGPAVGREAW